MDSLIRDCEKLAKHQHSSSQKALSSITAAINALTAVKAQLSADTQLPANNELLAAARKATENAQSTASEQLKELYTNVAKYGKHVEKTFKLDLGAVAGSRAFEDKNDELGQAVLLHFLREGEFDVARTFASETGLSAEDSVRERLEAMHEVVSQMTAAEHNLDGALEWTLAHRQELLRRNLGVGLEFCLRRLRFLQLVEMGQTVDALKYAREWFPAFADTEAEEIEHLMGIFIYARRLHSSPYADMFAEQRWEDGARMFAAAFCALQGLAVESPLSITVRAGANALPVVCKVSGLLRDRRVEWSQQDELPVEVPLPSSMRFHSVFACPVSKEQATATNPPMMLPCGHVICRASLEKLARGIRPGVVASGRFKCPYCPIMSSQADAKKVYF
ncbi:hypothetical protein GGI07_002826 [Coemansia sp. Benny D115]|nr:hypothetical protein GGI07_002826 [Coemansia sp. Benny D115]